MSSLTRFNPKTGIVDFWTEFRKPNPYRVPMLLASTVPLLIIFYWLSGEVHYKVPERPQITYITTFDPERSDAEIMASNEANQEVKEMREAAEADLANRKREIYKTLGKGLGMDVDQIAAEADARRAAEAAAEAERRAAMFGEGSGEGGGGQAAPDASAQPPADTSRP
ncbi:MAG: hypothetical protein V2J14_03325 [Erythrobacter sp.]|jgi:hypothetical protein|nr:hypothetical protein [Erythrobacter sp.]